MRIMARRHKREQGIECASPKPGWVGSGIVKKSILGVDDFRLLFEFFVLESPYEPSSSMAVPLSKYGWGNKPWSTKNNRLLNRLLRDQGFRINENLFVGTSTKETKALFKDAKLTKSFKREITTETIAFYHSEKAQFVSIARHIRNSLAHGRFAAQKDGPEIILYFEDGIKNKGSFHIRSRMVLKLATIKKWIEIIKGGPHA